MGWWKKTIAAGMVTLAAILLESIRECRIFRMTHYELQLPKGKQGKPEKEHTHRIVFLSDLHNQVYGRNNEKLLDQIRKEQPDLILIGGDMIIGKREVLPMPALEFICKLPAIAPVYYTYGNHEQRMQKKRRRYKHVMERYQKALCEAGVHFLENSSADITIEDMEIRLTGLVLPLETYERFHDYNITSADIQKKVGGADPDRWQILVVHNPAYVSAYKEWGADLVLCGHLHGGVVRIPGWRGLISPQACLFPKYSGEMRSENGTVIVVSKGLGTHTVKLRLFNVPEVVVLHF